MIDRKTFFDRIRLSVFRGALPNEAVQGCTVILDEWERRGLTDTRHLAYMLATVRGECGLNMLPVREGFYKSDAESRAFVTRKGYKYAHEVNGQVYYGRGLVQLTWDYNYRKMSELLGVPLLSNPDLALQPAIAAKIMFEGMIRGTFTGKKLSDYFNMTLTDYVNARRIINGTDKASTFAAWAHQFYDALHDAQGAILPPPPDIAKPVNVPAPAPTKPSNTGGAIAGGTVIAGGAVVVNQSSKNGLDGGQLVIVAVCALVIAVAAFFIIRHWRRS